MEDQAHYHPKNMGGSETCRQGGKHSRDIRLREVTDSNRSTWSTSFFFPLSPNWKETLLGLELKLKAARALRS